MATVVLGVFESGGARRRMPFLLQSADVDRIEGERAGGVTSREVLRLFEGRGARLSAATFRKYVQAGLLPRSRRVGRKGKHTGTDARWSGSWRAPSARCARPCAASSG